MEDYYYTAEVAGHNLEFRFRNLNTVKYFGQFIKEHNSSQAENAIYTPISDYERLIEENICDSYMEYSMSVYRASDALLSFDRVIIHAAAMMWKGKVILLSAESGTGKSTQLRNWIKLFGDEVEILNGDKPVLKKETNGSFTVYPSPWKGKEHWGNDTLKGPLEAIILLKQGIENKIERKTPFQVAPLLLCQFFSTFESEDLIHHICRLEEEILKQVPVWVLTNTGDEASAMLTHNTLVEELHDV